MELYEEFVIRMRYFAKRNLLILLITLAIGTLIIGAISVQNSFLNTNSNLEHLIQPIVTIRFDNAAWRKTLSDQEIRELDWISSMGPRTYGWEHIKKISSLPYVRRTDIKTGITLSSLTLKDTVIGREDWEPNYFSLVGIFDTDIMHFDEGQLELIYGRSFNYQDFINVESTKVPAIVSQRFFTENNLHLGSNFELYHIVLYPNEERVIDWMPELFHESNIYKRVGLVLEIIGVYDFEENGTYFGSGYNDIFIPAVVFEDLEVRYQKANEDAWLTMDLDIEEVESYSFVPPAFFTLTDTTSIQTFKDEITSILPEFYYVVDLSTRFSPITTAMETLSQIVDFILIASVISGFLILGLIFTLSIRERKMEAGIYLALGEKKVKIVKRMLLDITIIGMIGMMLSLLTGNFLSGVITEIGLSNELESILNTSGSVSYWSEFNMMAIDTTQFSTNEMMEAFDTSLNMEAVLLMLALSIGMVVLSTTLPMLYILKINPKKLLTFSERG